MTPEDEQLFRERCKGMAEDFQYLVDTEELSRMPTEAEMAKVIPILRERIESGKWGDTTQELAHILCSVTSITTTLELP